MWDVRFSKRCCWNLMPAGTQRWVVRWRVTDVSKKRSASIFRARLIQSMALTDFLKIHFNIIIPTMPRFLTGLFPSRFSTKTMYGPPLSPNVATRSSSGRSCVIMWNGLIWFRMQHNAGLLKTWRVFVLTPAAGYCLITGMTLNCSRKMFYGFVCNLRFWRGRQLHSEVARHDCGSVAKRKFWTLPIFQCCFSFLRQADEKCFFSII